MAPDIHVLGSGIRPNGRSSQFSRSVNLRRDKGLMHTRIRNRGRGGGGGGAAEACGCLQPLYRRVAIRTISTIPDGYQPSSEGPSTNPEGTSP